MSKKRTQEEFETELFKLVGNDYTPLDQYVNNSTKIRMKHNTCGNIFEISPVSIWSGHRCPWCSGKKHYTTKEFSDLVRSKLNNEFELVGEYINSKTPVIFRHSKCGLEFSRHPMPFLKTGNCPACNPRGPERKTQEQFEADVKKINPNLTILGKYTGAQRKVLTHCNICGYQWEIKANGLLNGNGCPACSHSLRLTFEEVKKRVLDVLGDKYEIITTENNYKDTHAKLEILHKDCGKIYFAAPHSITCSKTKCPHCFGTPKLSHEVFISRVKQNNKNNISVLGTYNGRANMILCRCNNCGNEWNASPYNLERGSNCPKCVAVENGLKLRKTDEEFRRQLYDSHRGDIIALSKYELNVNKVKFKCTVCDYEFESTPLDISSGRRGCPVCATSKGERAIRNYLLDYPLKFIWHHIYDGLLGIRGGNLSYDFFIPDYNLLIEYQGEFHDGTACGQTPEDFDRQKEHDRRKKEYAEANNINLLEIWYWDFDNIESILTKYFLDNQAVA